LLDNVNLVGSINTNKNVNGVINTADKLQQILKNFDIPFYRLTFNKNNLMWLQKNLKKKNSKNKNYEIAKQLIDDCLNQRLYKS